MELPAIGREPRTFACLRRLFVGQGGSGHRPQSGRQFNRMPPTRAMPSSRRGSGLLLLLVSCFIASSTVLAFAPSRKLSSLPHATVERRRQRGTYSSSSSLHAAEAFFSPTFLDGATFQQSSTFVLADAAAAAIGAIGQKPMLASLLHTPTLWSVLAMTSIVALLVAWEESIE